MLDCESTLDIESGDKLRNLWTNGSFCEKQDAEDAAYEAWYVHTIRRRMVKAEEKALMALSELAELSDELMEVYAEGELR